MVSFSLKDTLIFIDIPEYRNINTKSFVFLNSKHTHMHTPTV